MNRCRSVDLLSSKYHHYIFAEQKCSGCLGAANLLIECALIGVSLLAERDERVEPHPRSEKGVRITDRLHVRRFDMENLKAGSVQDVAQL